MRSIKTSLPYLIATASFIFLFSSNIFSREHRNVFEFIKDTLPSNDSLATMIFEKPEVLATNDQWTKYLQKGLMDLIIDAASSGIKNGTYYVKVRFVVERNGKVSNAEILDNPLEGPQKAVKKIEKEVKQLIESSPKWMSAEINGEKVRSYRIQLLTFMISQ